MRKLFLFLLFNLFLWSCETTEEPKDGSGFQLIGSVNLRLELKNEIGRKLGQFNCGYYLSKTKIELLHNGKVIEKTYPIADTSYDAIYILKNVELNKPYKIKMTLNDEMIEYTDEFIINKEDVKHFPYDSITKGFTDNLKWFVEGEYYSNFLFYPDNNGNFNLNTNDTILTLYPNPVSWSGQIELAIYKSGFVNLTVWNIDKSFSKEIRKDTLQPGRHSFLFGEKLEDGLYFVKMIKDGSVYYCPFLKGRKGAPAMP